MARETYFHCSLQLPSSFEARQSLQHLFRGMLNWSYARLVPTLLQLLKRLSKRAYRRKNFWSDLKRDMIIYDDHFTLWWL